MNVLELETTLNAWLDHFPMPPPWTGDLHKRGLIARAASFTDEKKTRCRTCKGTGKLPNKRTCHECKGNGAWNYDPYVGKVYAGDLQLAPPIGTTRRHGTERERTGDPILDAMADQHAHRDNTQTYRRLETLIAKLHPQHRCLIAWHYVLGYDRPTPDARHALDALATLAHALQPPRWVTDNIAARRAAATQAKGRHAPARAQAARNTIAIELRQQGLTLQAIGHQLGIHKSTVHRAIRNEAA